MSWSYSIYTKENITVEDVQKIINELPDNWFRFNGERDEKPIKQDWGWSTIVDISNPWKNWEDEDYGLGTVGVLNIGGSFTSSDVGKDICNFIELKLKEMNYNVLKIGFSY